jgi:pilus assembly protein CpaB
MRLFAIFVLFFGLALTGGALYKADKFEEERANAVRAVPTTVRILIANRTLTQGDILAAESLTWVEWPVTAVPEGAFSSTKALFGEDHQDRRYVTRTIEPGEPILSARISDPNQAGTIKDKLPPGFRAVSIRVDDVTSVAGFVSVGDRVDVLLTHAPQGQLVSKVFLQDIEVLAVDQIIDSERNDPRLARTVTILVTTRQAQLISLALQQGKLSLVLRSEFPAAAGDSPAPSVGIDDLNGVTRAPVDPGKSVRVRKGTSDVQEVRVE